MSRSQCVALLFAAASTIAAGCSPFGVTGDEVTLPPAAQFISDNAARFRSPADDPLASHAPGTVIDDLSKLDGCWASVFVEDGKAVALYSIYQFDAAAGTVTATSFVGHSDGGIAPRLPILSVLSGRFTISGPASIAFAWEQASANVDFESNELVSELQPVPLNDIGDQVAVVTLDGDRLVLWIDAARPEDVTATSALLIYQRFDCPTE